MVMVIAAVMLCGPMQAHALFENWLPYLFGSGTTFNQLIIQQPGSGGIYGAACMGYPYTHGVSPFSAPTDPYSFYNFGYLNSLSNSPLYNSPSGYPNIFPGIMSLLSIGN